MAILISCGLSLYLNFSTGPTYRHKQPVTLTIKPMSNLESLITLTCISFDCGKHSPRFLRGSIAFKLDVPAPFFTTGANFFLLPNIVKLRSISLCLPLFLHLLRPLSFLWQEVRSLLYRGPAGGECASLHSAPQAAPHAFILEEDNRSQANPSPCWCHWDWI